MEIPNAGKYAKRGGKAPKTATPVDKLRRGKFPDRPPPGVGDLIPANREVPSRRDDTIIEVVSESCLYLSSLIPIVGESKGMTLDHYRKLNSQLEAFIKMIDDGCRSEHREDRCIR